MSKHELSNVFNAYANVYDALYCDKDYDSECDFLEEIFNSYGQGKIETILDMGCGTAGHAIPLARRGYNILGIDRSKEMLALANQKTQEAGVSDKLRFKASDIQNIECDETFDAAICMFAVLSYQISNDRLFSAICSARKHLEVNGLFVCDFWYGPAVLNQRPTERVKVVNDGHYRIIRLVKPEIDVQENVVCVNYNILKLKGDRLIEEVREKHPMRFIFKREIEFFLKQAGFRLEHFCCCGDLNKQPSETTWNVTAVAHAI